MRIERRIGTSLLLVAILILRVTFSHHNKYFCALIHGAGNKPLAAIKHPLITVLLDTKFNISRIA